MNSIKKIIIVLIYFNLVSCTTEKNVDFNKYEILTRPAELIEFYNIALDTSGSSESATIKKWVDNAFDFSYSFETRDTEKHQPLLYYIDISKRNSIDEAKTKFNIIKTQFNNTWILDSELSVNVIENVLTYGDENYYAIRKTNKESYGIFVALRKGNVIYSMIMTEFYTEDHSLITNLIEPKLIKLENFKLID